MGEARRLFFNSHKELRNMMKTVNEQQNAHQTEKAALIKKINEVQSIARKAMGENRQIKEAAIRSQTTSRLLQSMPVGSSREKMKVLLESSAVADLEKTFRKFAPSILNETKTASQGKARLDEQAIGIRNGNGHQPVVENSEDDDDIVNLRRLSGIVRK